MNNIYKTSFSRMGYGNNKQTLKKSQSYQKQTQKENPNATGDILQ